MDCEQVPRQDGVKSLLSCYTRKKTSQQREQRLKDHQKGTLKARDLIKPKETKEDILPKHY